MPKNKLGWMLGVYRVSILSIVGFMAWMRTEYVGNEKFDNYVKSHETWSQEVLRGLRYDLGDIKTSVRRIEDRMDKQRGASLPFFPGFPLYDFKTTNFGGVKENIYGRRN